jgi:membrane protein implicated in regulation of membrane protease activity
MLFGFGFVSMRWIWTALVIIFALIEVFTLGLYTVWFAIAALVMVFVSLLQIPLPYQLLIFLAISSLLLFITRPIVVKKLKIGKEKTNVENLVGMRALVTRDIAEFNTGEVKLNGQFWTALAENNESIPKGAKCEVVRIEGVKAVVRLIEEIED